MTKKIAISSKSDMLDGYVDPRFGRAAGFIIFNLENDEFKYLDNSSSQNMNQGAGIKAASNIIKEKIVAILTGFVGPKAYKVLESAKVRIIQDLSGLSVREAIDFYKKGRIVYSTTPKCGPRKRGRK